MSLPEKGHVFLFILIRSLLFSLGAALWATVALCVSAIKPEPFLVLSVPLISSYLIENFIDDYLKMYVPSYLNIIACISGERLIYGGMAVNLIYGIALLLFFIAIAGNVFHWLVKRSVQGESVF